MLSDVELSVYNKYIKELVVEVNGLKKLAKEDLEKLNLSQQEKNFIMYILNKLKIKLTEEKIKREDRSPYVRDNNYGDIKANELQKMDEPVMSKIEYSTTNEKVYEDYEELDEYLETRFIPTYVLLKVRKNENGEIEHYPSIRLHHIMALKLSDAELEHVMEYLKNNNIRVGGKGTTLDNEFDNYDYVTTYKESALPLSTTSNVTLQKIAQYKQNNDRKLREEIIMDNMRLVPFVVRRYTIATGIDHHELESYGYEGLIIALDKYDVNYGCCFSTYAVAYIRGYVLKGIQEILNEKQDHLYYHYINAKNAVESECGVTLKEAPELIEDVIDLLVATGKIKDNKNAKEYARMKISTLAIGNLSLDDEETFEELITSDQLIDTHDYAEEVINSISREVLEKMLDKLSPREAEILSLRFGLVDGQTHTHAEIGKRFNLHKGTIWLIEKKALEKLRKPDISSYLEDFYDDFETEKYGR